MTDELLLGDFHVLDPAEYDFGHRLKRHGGLLEISDEVMELLICAFGKEDGQSG